MAAIMLCISNPDVSTSPTSSSSSSAHLSKSTFKFAGFLAPLGNNLPHHFGVSFTNTANTCRPVVAYVHASILTFSNNSNFSAYFRPSGVSHPKSKHVSSIFTATFCASCTSIVRYTLSSRSHHFTLGCNVVAMAFVSISIPPRVDECRRRLYRTESNRITNPKAHARPTRGAKVTSINQRRKS